MNTSEYKIFHQVTEVFKRALKDSIITWLHVDQRDYSVRGESKNYTWTIKLKHKANKPKE